MKTCQQCGTQLNDEVMTCPVCGVNVTSAPAPAAAYVPPVYAPVPAPVPAPQKAVSVWGWVGRYALNLIPAVGSLVYFIMLFVWAFDSKYDDTSRNWAKAQLVIAAIVAGLVFLLFVLLLVLGITAADVFSEMMYF